MLKHYSRNVVSILNLVTMPKTKLAGYEVLRLLTAN